jgi:hypothetical protein
MFALFGKVVAGKDTMEVLSEFRRRFGMEVTHGVCL